MYISYTSHFKGFNIQERQEHCAYRFLKKADSSRCLVSLVGMVFPVTRCFFVAWRFVAPATFVRDILAEGGRLRFAGVVTRSPCLSLSPSGRELFLSCCFLKSIPSVELWRCKLRQTRSTLIPITLYNAWQFFTAWSSHAVPITK